MKVDDIIKNLGLTEHWEGGYLREKHTSSTLLKADEISTRPRATLSTCYFLLAKHRNLLYFAVNECDIVHFFHGGDPITYHVISQEFEWKTIVLGSDLSLGHVPQFTVEAGSFKAAFLSEESNYGLISEAVSPAYEEQGNRMISASELINHFPERVQEISRLCLN